MSPRTLRLGVAPLVLAACAPALLVPGEPPAPPPPEPHATSAPRSASPPLASAPASSAPLPAPRPLFGGLDDDTLPPAPCDLARVYRGRLGDRPLTVALTREGDQVRGSLHEDRPGPTRTLSGHVTQGQFVLAEAGAGTLTGSCDQATGWLRGFHELKGKKTPLVLRPRPAGESPLYVLREQRKVWSNNPPECQKLGALREVKRLPPPPGRDDGVTCLPTDPRVRQQVLGDSSLGSCSLSLEWPRPFALPDPVAEQHLGAFRLHDGHVYTLVPDRAADCKVNEESYGVGGYQIVHNQHQVLSLLTSGDIMFSGAAHPTRADPMPLSVDLRTGDTLALRDLVVDEQRFLALGLSCLPAWGQLPDHEAGEDHFSWGRPDSISTTPSWIVASEGIALLGTGFPHALMALSGCGPVVSFAALQREGLLRADSPVARLWQDIAPAAPAAPACTWGLLSDVLVALPPA